MKKARLFIVLFCLSFIALQASQSFAQSAAITNGVNYLVSSQNTDGSWGTDYSNSDPVTATAVVLQALSVLGESSSPAYQAGASWLASQPLSTTDPISRRILSGASLSTDPGLLIAGVDDMRKAWGGIKGYDVNNLDSALALLALKRLNSNDLSTIGYGINFLLSYQNTDGGWGFTDTGDSKIYYTALANLALQDFNGMYALANPVSNGQSYLLANQNSDGGFGSAASTIDQTALAYLALQGSYFDSPELTQALEYLTTSQFLDGSWANEPFGTALALIVLDSDEKAHLPTPPSRIIGKVIDGGAGQALAGVNVDITGNVNLALSTLLNGTFMLLDMSAGTYSLHFTFAGYEPFDKVVTVAAGATHDFGELPMNKLVEPVTAITGIVTEAGTGLPIVGATVNVSGANIAIAVTNAAGEYRINGLNPGGVIIAVSRVGYADISVSTTVAINQTIIFSPALNTGGGGQSGGGGTGTAGLHSQILANDTGQPLSGVEVTITLNGSGVTTYTDGNGYFSFSGLEAGVSPVVCLAAGYLPYSMVIVTQQNTIWELNPITMVRDGSNDLPPDLIIEAIDLASAANDPQTLALSGTLRVTVKNVGEVTAPPFAEVTAFYDANQNSLFENGIDIALARTFVLDSIASGESKTVALSLQGVSPFRDAPVSVWVDSLESILESDEENNVSNTSEACPDLTAGLLRVIDNGHGVFDLAVRIGNGGLLAVEGNISVSFYEGAPENGGGLLGTNKLNSLGKGAFTDVILTNVSRLVGGKEIAAVVDHEGLVLECNENNNSVHAAGPPLFADLGVSGLQFIDNGAGNPVSLSFTIENIGTASSSEQTLIAVYDGEPIEGGVLLGTMTVDAVQVGASQQFSYEGLDGNGLGPKIFLVVDADDKVREYVECNNTAYVTVPSATFGTVAVNTDKVGYRNNEEVLIQAQIVNASGFPGEFIVRLQFEDANGFVVESLPAFELGQIESGWSVDVGASWNSAEYLTGSYAVRVYLDTPVAQSIHSAVSAFEIIHDEAALPTLGLRTTTDKIKYLPGETVRIANLITNQTGSTIVDNTRLRLRVDNQAGGTVYTNDLAPGQLVPGMQKDLKALFALAALPAGLYKLKGEVVDNLDGHLWAADQATFEVLGTESTGVGITGYLSVDDQIYMGRPLTATYGISNSGNEDVNDLSVRILLIRPETDTLVLTVEELISLTRQTTYVGTMSGDTSQLEPGFYMAVLTVATPVMVKAKTLGSANFEVLPSLEAEATAIDPVNLLVWINDGCEPPNSDNENDECSDNDNEDREEHYSSRADYGKAKYHSNYASDADESSGHGEGDESNDQDESLNGSKCVPADFLGEALAGSVYSYSLIWDRKDFEREIRNPFYTDIMILGDQHQLTDHVAEELRELVNSGTGLVSGLWAATNPPGMIFDFDINGSLSEGKDKTRIARTVISPISNDDSFEINSPVYKLGNLAPDMVVVGSVADGKSNHHCDEEEGKHGGKSKDECGEDLYPAIVLGELGLGKEIYFAFNPGLSLGTDVNQQVAALIRNSIEYSHSYIEVEAFRPFQMVPVNTRLKSLGGNFNIRLTSSYAPDLSLLDQLLGTWVTYNPFVMDTVLAADELKDISYFALMPDQEGGYAISTDVELSFGQEYILFDTLLHEFNVGLSSQNLAESIMNDLFALNVSKKERQKIKKATGYVNKVRLRAADNQCEFGENIRNVLDAIDSLSNIIGTGPPDIRLRLDALLRINQSRWYLSDPQAECDSQLDDHEYGDDNDD